jgi:NB-ARC domain
MNVPPLMPHVVSRSEHDELVHLLLAGSSRLIEMVGIGGVGKTTAAIQAVNDQRVGAKFEAGIVWLTLGDHADYSAILSQLVVALQVGPEYHFSSDPEREIALRETFGDQELLVVLDDLWDHEALVLPLSRVLAEATFLITSRVGVSVSSDSTILLLGNLTEADAIALLRDQAGVEIDSEVARELVASSQGWPLLVSLVASRIRQDVSFGASVETAARDVLAGMTSGPGALRGLASDSSTLQALMDSTLSELDDRALDVLRYLSSYPSEKVPVSAIVSADIDERTARRALTTLAARSLIEWDRSRDQVAVHDLIADYMNSRAADSEGESVRE